MNNEIESLTQLIEKYQKSYYDGEAEITDAEFDSLWDRLSQLDPKNALLQKVGADSSGVFEKAKHIIPMGSQEKAANPEQFTSWALKHQYKEYLVEYKLDGASLELQYNHGKFVKAVTRGDGIIGDDITRNVLKMKGVVRQLSGDFTGGIRGEVIMTHHVHDTLFADKANCRNAANGLMKRKDGEGSEHLEVICYDAFFTDTGNDKSPFNDEIEKMNWLSDSGFFTSPVEICTTANDVIAYRAKVMELRSSLDYDIDGLVIKCKEIDMDDASRNRPDKQIAFKFSLEEAISVVRKVIWNENGATYTPIAEFDTVDLNGTKVSRASLANPNTIKDLGLFIGSHVVVTKRGEIIPKIEYVLRENVDVDAGKNSGRCLSNMGNTTPYDKTISTSDGVTSSATNATSSNKTPERPKLDDLPLFASTPEASHPIGDVADSSTQAKPNALKNENTLEPVTIPTVCGTCGTHLTNEGTRLFCPNKACPKRIQHKLEKWISVIDIRDFGTTLIKSLFDSGEVTSISDIYSLTEEKLTSHFLNSESIEKEKVSLGARKVLSSIEKSRKMPLAEFIAGFDIEGIGETMVEKLIEAGYTTLESLLQATETDIAKVYMFAEITAHTLVIGLQENAEEMRTLVESGIITLDIPDTANGKFAGLSFCFTGELHTMKRSDAEKLVKTLGGSAKSSVVKGLSYLVTNDTTSGSSKNKKAAELGIPIIDENTFVEMTK